MQLKFKKPAEAGRLEFMRMTAFLADNLSASVARITAKFRRDELIIAVRSDDFGYLVSWDDFSVSASGLDVTVDLGTLLPSEEVTLSSDSTYDTSSKLSLVQKDSDESIVLWLDEYLEDGTKEFSDDPPSGYTLIGRICYGKVLAGESSVEINYG